MKELIVWLIHFPTGTLAILAAIAALYYPKGSSKHRKAGRVFTAAMSIMLIGGGIAGALVGSVENVFLAALVFYAVFTAWLAARPRQPGIGVLEYLAPANLVFPGLGSFGIWRQDSKNVWLNDRSNALRGCPTVQSCFVRHALLAIQDLQRESSRGRELAVEETSRVCMAPFEYVAEVIRAVASNLDSASTQGPLSQLAAFQRSLLSTLQIRLDYE
ncbi:MAG: hypothetical protein PVF50_06475 [Gammaproteobacteria bacterium]